MSEREERRRHERYAVSYPVSVKRLTRNPDAAAREEFSARTVDLSVGGARLETKELVHRGEEIRLVIEDQRTDFGLDCTAKVRWSNKMTGCYHIGVEFVKVGRFKPSREEAPQG